MTPQQAVSLTPHELVRLFSRHRLLLAAPAVAAALVALVATIVIPRPWKAEQGLLIRSDAAGYADQRLGKFTDLSEMKTVQETLLELARSQRVVTAVLQAVGDTNPTPQDIADFRDNLRLTPPGGAEFGKTEVFYIGVLDPNRDRAIAMVDALTAELDARLRELRDQRAGSMVAEVQRSAEVARELLHLHVEELATFEQSVGADLVELRHLISPNGGQSELSQKSLSIDEERRRLAENRQRAGALLVELRGALEAPERIIATPDALLASQPGLRRLKNGLVDAQLTVARTAGVRTPDHPYVVAARHAQAAVQGELTRELPAAIAGVELELEVIAKREAELARQVEGLRGRSAELAGLRSRYAELVANVDGQTQVLGGALQQLADAKAHRAGVNSASLLAKIDGVETGVRPDGPSRKAVVAAGGLAGLLLGGTLVFLLHAPPAPQPAVPSFVNPPQAATPAPVTHPPTARPAPAAASTTVAWADSPWAVERAADRGATVATGA